jgi:hypothetical protein
MPRTTYQRLEDVSEADEHAPSGPNRKPHGTSLGHSDNALPSKTAYVPNDAASETETLASLYPHGEFKGDYMDGFLHTSPQPIPTPPKGERWHLPLVIGLCMFMHALLVLGFVALIVLFFKSKVFQVSDANVGSMIGKVITKASKEKFFVNFILKVGVL